MKNMLKAFVLIFISAFIFSGYVNAENTEQTESEVQGNVQIETNNEGKVESQNTEEVVEPVIEKVFNIASNDNEQNDGVALASEEPTNEADEVTEEPSNPIAIIDIFDERTNKISYTYTDTTSNHGKLLNINTLLQTGGAKVNTVVSDGKTYTFDGYYLDGTKITSAVSKEEVTFSPIETSTNPYGLKITTGNLTKENKITITAKWTVESNEPTQPTDPTEPTEPTQPTEPVKHPVKVTFVFIEQSESGAVIHSGNSLPSVTNTINPNGSWTKLTNALTIKSFHSGNYRYTVDTWYNEDGTPVPESLYYNGDVTRIRYKYTWSENDPEEVTFTYILKWKEKKDNIYKFYIHDEISNGSNHWNNTNGHEGSYTKTFRAPTNKPHYKFLYYKHEETGEKYEAGSKYSIDIASQGEGLTLEDNFYAYWQPDVTLNLYSDGKLLSTQSSFESVTIDTTPTKYGYEFLGWVDKDGNIVNETTFTPNEEGTKPEPKTINLYASWKRIMVDVKVTKTWDDSDNNDGIRPDSITIELKNGDEVVKTEELNEDNKWTITFNVPKYDDTKEIQYSVNEKEVEGYTSNITGSIKEGFTVTNTHEVEKIKSIAVQKVWDDNNDEDEIRPESITVYLLGNGEKVQEVVLSEKNNWESIFENVNVYDGGKEIEYTVSEEEIEFYEVTVDGSKEDGFTVINYHEPWPKGDGDEPEEPTNEDNNKNNNNPKTGDDIVTNIIMLLMSLTGLASGIIYLNKNKLAKNN